MLSPLYCRYCGAVNQFQAISCHSCGHSLRVVKPPIAHSATGRFSSKGLLKQRYHVIACVGKGGMGAVYKAEDTLLGNRQVALKEMNQRGLNPQEQKAAAYAFKQEAMILARLQHPNLPSVFDHFEENRRWYLVMSFIEGETLQNYLSHAWNGKLVLDEVLQIGIQLCTVLSYLHNQLPAIIFRDLKLANIMRTSNGQIYLIDFGIARHFKLGQAKDTVSYVTMGYAPPEQYGKAQTTPQSDIYSLGVVLYQLLSGHDPSTTPFQFPPLQSLVPSVPLELATLIARMLELDSNKRPMSVFMVDQTLQSLALSPRGLPLTSALQTAAPVDTLSTSPTILPPTSLKRGLRRRTLLGGMLGVLIATSGLAYLASRSQMPSNSNSPLSGNRSKTPSTQDLGWSRWSEVPSAEETTSSPASASYQNTLYLFVRGTDSRIYQNTLNGSNWSGWSQPPFGNWQTTSAPSAIQYGNILYLFIQGLDSRIYQNTLNGRNWSGWSEVPCSGLTPRTPDAIQYKNTLSLYVQGTDNGIFQNTFDGSSWGSWLQLPFASWQTPVTPDAVQYGNTLYLFIQGFDSKIYQNTFDGGSWGSWREVPNNGQTISTPAAVQYRNTLYLFIQGTDNGIYQNTFIRSK